MDHTTFAEWLTGLALPDIARVFDQLGTELQSRELYALAFRAQIAAEMTRDRYFGPKAAAAANPLVEWCKTRPRVGHGQEGVE
jgi:hypothetical protein